MATKISISNEILPKLGKRKFFLLLIVVFCLTNVFLIGSASNQLSTNDLSVTNQANIFNTQYKLGFSSYLGSTGSDQAKGVAVDSYGNVFMAGITDSAYFPIKNAFNGTYGGNSDAFITEFNSTGYLLSSSFLGGSNYDSAVGIAIDTNNNVIITGRTSSTNFPVKNAYQNHNKGGTDVFVTKFDSKGNLVFSTYLGGTLDDYATSVAVDHFGNIYVTGFTDSSDFTLKNAWNSTFNSQPSFVAKFDPLGYLIYSTYFSGGSHINANSIAADSNGNCYITGITYSLNGPVTPDAIQPAFNGGSFDAFLAKFNSTGFLTYASYLGGNQTDQGYAITIDQNNSVYITGITTSKNFPLKNPWNSTLISYTVFVSKFQSNGSLMYSTLLSSAGFETPSSISVDNNGNMFIGGSTIYNKFPTMNSLYSYPGSSAAFVSEFASNGNLVFSSYYGGSLDQFVNSIAVDKNDNIFFVGYTDSTDIPLASAYYQSFSGNLDAYIVKFDTMNPFPTSQVSSSITTTSLSSTLTSASSSTPSATSSISSKLNNSDILNSSNIIIGLGLFSGLSLLVNIILILKRRK